MADSENPPAADHVLSAELLDGLTEAIVKPGDPRVRAQVISEMVHEVDEAVRWRHQLHPGSEEEQSLVALVEAAADHQERMAELGETVDADDDQTGQAGLGRRRLPSGSHPASDEDN